MRGGINAKAIALQHLKTQIKFVESIGGIKVPRSSFEDWSAAAQKYLSFRLLGVGSLRWIAKEISRARDHWKGSRQQTQLNEISEMLIKAEQRCIDREAKRKDKRLILGVLAPKPAGHTPAGYVPPTEKVDGRRKPVEPLPQAPLDQDALWASMEKK